jgi:hypothetical protein
MVEPTDPTGAWIDHLRRVKGKERALRLDHMTEHERDAALLRLLSEVERCDEVQARLQVALALTKKALSQCNAILRGDEEVSGG